jgi:hypothetical protein
MVSNWQSGRDLLALISSNRAKDEVQQCAGCDARLIVKGFSYVLRCSPCSKWHSSDAAPMFALCTDKPII